MTNDIHVFEKAGLGKAPFKVVGFTVEKYQACQGAPIQVGGSCDYCGTGIMNTYHIQSADGNTFKVGCECVNKTGDKGMIKRVQKMERDRKRKDRHAREAKRVNRMFGLLSMDTVRDDLASRPHPMDFRADQGDTELDWAEWLARNSGTSGRIRVARKLEDVAKGLGIDLDTVTPMTRNDYFKPEPAPEPEPEPAPEPTPVSHHVGTVGKRIELAVKVQFTADWETNFGTQYLVNMIDAEGNVLVYKGSNPPLYDDDEAVIRGTVKSHGSYRGTLQTVVNRVQVRSTMEGDHEIRRVGRVFKVFKGDKLASDEDFYSVLQARQAIARDWL